MGVRRNARRHLFAKAGSGAIQYRCFFASGYSAGTAALRAIGQASEERLG